MNKIVVCGKGGSGKSSLVALLANAMRTQGRRVIVVDADESNPGLYRLLGLPARPEPLMNLLGGKKRVLKSYAGQLQPDNSVLLQESLTLDELPPDYYVQRDGITLVAVGKIMQSLEGCACPIGFLSREFLRRLTLGEGEVALVDTEAGVEHFGRGVAEGADGILVVVDPSYDAIALAIQVQAMARQVGLPGALAVVNKAPDETLGWMLRGKLESEGLRVVGCIGYHPMVLQAGLEGRLPVDAQAERDVAQLAVRLLQEA
jgi:CO dehydrogenase maturation factor